MNIFNPVKISFKNLLAAKFRSFLTILGVIIGTASVIMVASAGRSAQDLILGQLEGVGSNLIVVLPGASDENGPPAAAFGIVTPTLTYEDFEVLSDGKTVPEIEAGAGYVRGAISVSYLDQSISADLMGLTSDYLSVEDGQLSRGRFFLKEEDQNLSRVAILGNGLAEDIFGNEDPVGKKITLKKQSYEVVGVLSERGASGFGASGQDNAVFLPLRTAQRLILNINNLGYIRLKAKSADLVAPAKEAVRLVLRDRHNIKLSQEDDFSVRDQASAIKIVTTITDVLRYFLLVIGSISLLVGGIGIMNIMLIAVNQRIKEVGLRKALGARKNDVYFQFLMESATVSLIGGFLGIILGVGLSFLASVIVQLLGYDWKFLVSPWSILIAVSVSALIGLVFGFYPARKASQISPMEALRYE